MSILNGSTCMLISKSSFELIILSKNPDSTILGYPIAAIILQYLLFICIVSICSIICCGAIK